MTSGNLIAQDIPVGRAIRYARNQLENHIVSGLDFILRRAPAATDPVPAFHHAPSIGAEDDAPDIQTAAAGRRYILEPYFSMIEYTDSRGNLTRRRITMRVVEDRGPHKILFAQCHERGAPRTFRLDRIACLISQDGEVEEAAEWFAEVLANSESIPIGSPPPRQPSQRPTAGPSISPYTALRRAISPALVVLIAAARSDDYLHPRERDRILRFCEDEAVALRSAGKITAFIDADDFDKLDRTIQRLRPTQDDLIAAFEGLAALDANTLRRLARALADTIRADGRIDELETVILNGLQRMGTAVHGFGWDNGDNTAEVVMNDFRGCEFVFTGQLTSMSRNEANAAVRDAGGTVAGQITPDTDFLVAGPDAVLSERKLHQAHLLGAKVIGEAEFLAMIGRG